MQAAAHCAAHCAAAPAPGGSGCAGHHQPQRLEASIPSLHPSAVKPFVAPRHRRTRSLSPKLLRVPAALLQQTSLRATPGAALQRMQILLPAAFPPLPRTRDASSSPAPVLGHCQRAPAPRQSVPATVLACRLLAGDLQARSESRLGQAERQTPCSPRFYHRNDKTDAKGTLHPGRCGKRPPPRPALASAAGAAAGCFQAGALPPQWLWWGWAARGEGKPPGPHLCPAASMWERAKAPGDMGGHSRELPGSGCLLQERTTAMPTPLLIALVLCLAACLLRGQGRDNSHPGIGLVAFGAVWGSPGWGRLGSGAGCCTLRLSSRNTSVRARGDEDQHGHHGGGAAAGL